MTDVTIDFSQDNSQQSTDMLANKHGVHILYKSVKMAKKIIIQDDAPSAICG